MLSIFGSCLTRLLVSSTTSPDQYASTKFGFHLRIARAAERLRLVFALTSSGEERAFTWLGSLLGEAAPSDFEAVRTTLLALAYSSKNSDLSVKVIPTLYAVQS